MRARHAAPLLVLLLAACGGKTGPTQTQVVPSTPKGTVWGQVVDAATQAPLADASVSLSVSGAAMTAKTGSDGAFQFTDVPAGGQVGVSLSKSGYTSATIPVTVPATAGNFPVDGSGAYVGPIALFPTTGTIHLQVIGYDGSLIDGATVSASSYRGAYVNLSTNTTAGVVIATGKTAGGAVDLTALPDFDALAHYNPAGLVVTAGPVDTNGDGIPEYLGTSVTLSPGGLATSGGRATVTLPPPGGSTVLGAIASNVGSIFHGGRPQYGGSVLAASDPVRVIFNQPVDPTTAQVTLQDDTGASVATATSVKQGNVVEIAPKTSLAAGGAYYFTLQIRAAGNTSGSYRAGVSGWFYVPAGNTSPAVASVVFQDKNSDNFLDAGDEMDIVVDRAVGGDQGIAYSINLYLNADLDGSGTVGDGPYEAGSTQAIQLQPLGPPVGPFPGLVRTYRAILPGVAPVGAATPYQFGLNTNLAYIIDFPGSPGVLDAEGQPLDAAEGQFTVTF